MKMERAKIIVQSPAGRNNVIHLPYAVAFAAARGIAVATHFGVILYGTYGTARFNSDGSGQVDWNEKSTCPGETTSFAERTMVCI